MSTLNLSPSDDETLWPHEPSFGVFASNALAVSKEALHTPNLTGIRMTGLIGYALKQQWRIGFFYGNHEPIKHDFMLGTVPFTPDIDRRFLVRILDEMRDNAKGNRECHHTK